MEDLAQSKDLRDYLDHLQTDDIVAATQEARRKSMRVLEDQDAHFEALGPAIKVRTPEEFLAERLHR